MDADSVLNEITDDLLYHGDLNAALRRTGGKKSAAASLLRIDPQRMKYLCRTLKI